MYEDIWFPDEGPWRCRKHPSQPRTGVCATCLRNRLLRLCPDCARTRPCGCSASCSSTSSSSRTNSSCSTSLSFSLSGDPPSGREGSVGAIGRVSQLIESEPPFRRSRSAVASRRLPRSDGDEKREKENRLWWLWPFGRGGSKKMQREKEAVVSERDKQKRAAEVAVAVRLYRSRSVSLARVEAPAAAVAPARYSNASADVRWKGWNWYFPSPMKAFSHRSKASKVLHERSPRSAEDGEQGSNILPPLNLISI